MTRHMCRQRIKHAAFHGPRVVGFSVQELSEPQGKTLTNLELRSGLQLMFGDDLLSFRMDFLRKLRRILRLALRVRAAGAGSTPGGGNPF